MRKAHLLILVSLLALYPALMVVPISAQGDVTVSISPDSGPIGITVTVSGTIPTAGGKFSVYWDYVREWDGRYGKVAEGYADGNDYNVSFPVPPAYRGGHNIIVLDETSGKSGAAVFSVEPEISVTPSSSAPGALIVVSGYLINGEEIEVRFDGTVLGRATTDAITGYFELTAAVPGVAPGVYLITAYWNNEEQASAPFTVLPSPSITLTPSSGYPGDLVAVAGRNFAPNSHVTIYFDNIKVAEADTDNNGEFTTNFTAPMDAQPGPHTVTAIDDVFMVPAYSQFTVLSPGAVSVAVRPRSMMYYQGDWMSIYVNSTAPFHPSSEILVEIYDADGIPFAAHRISASQIVQVNGYYVAPYYASLVSPVVPSDAKVGVWQWRATYRLAGEPNPRVVTGQVIVAPRSALLQDIINMLCSINTRLEWLEDRADEIVALIVDKSGAIIARIDSAESNIIGMLASGFEDVRSRLSTLQQLMESANALLTEVSDGVARIETGIGTLYMKVEDLRGLIQEVGANVTAVDGKVATIESASLEIKATLEALNPKIERIEDGIVYLTTAIGNVSSTLEALNATIIGVADTASGEIIASIDTAAGKILVRIDELEAALSDLIVNSKNEVIVRMSTSLGAISAKLDSVNATIVKVSGDVAEIKTTVGTLTANVSQIKNLLEGMGAELTAIKDNIGVIKVGVSNLAIDLANLTAVIDEVRNGTALIKTAVGEVKASVNELAKVMNGSIIEVKTAIIGAEKNIVGRIEAAGAEVYAKLNALNASLAGLIANAKGEILAVINTNFGTLYARLNGINATLAAVDEGRLMIQSLLGETYLSVEDARSLLTDVWHATAGEGAAIPAKIDNATASLKAGLLNSLIPKITEVKMLAEASAESSEKASEAISGIGIPIYATLASAAAAAATSIIAMIEATRRRGASS